MPSYQPASTTSAIATPLVSVEGHSISPRGRLAEGEFLSARALLHGCVQDAPAIWSRRAAMPPLSDHAIDDLLQRYRQALRLVEDGDRVAELVLAALDALVAELEAAPAGGWLH